MKAGELTPDQPISWRKISITLKTSEKGEEKAHTCDIACYQQFVPSSDFNEHVVQVQARSFVLA